MKYNVLFVGALMKDTNEIWGGTIATATAYYKSFSNHEKYNIIFISRSEIKTIEDFKKIINKYDYDILHVDDTRILNLIYSSNIKPDVIGPITRSPIKTYGGNWNSDYDSDYFYSSKIIRLNKSEEYLKNGEIDFTDKIFYINHGIDTNFLLPSNKEKNIILWAGDKNRTAKGYDMWLKIQENIELPNGYEYMTLSGYNVEDYWELLNNTKILINTSLYETFCCAMFEAKSKAIPSIYRKNLHNGRHLDGRIQVEYTVDGYKEEILKLLIDETYYKIESEKSREYTINNFSLKRMSETYCDVYDLILKEKIK